MKFGVNQIGKNPPVWLSRLSSALIIILGAFAVYSLSIPETILTLENKNFLGATCTFLVSLVEVFKLFTGQ